MNFGVSENNSNESNDSLLSKIIPIVIIVGVVIIVFILVFSITNSILNRKKTEPKKPVNTVEKLDIKSQDVSILYKYVTTNTTGIRPDKFIKNKKIDKNSFSDEEKLYFALQYAAVDDFKFVEEDKDTKERKYSILLSKIKKYVTRFFGPDVTMKEYVPIEYTFSFKINGKNVGNLEYSEEDKSYIASFNEYIDLDKKDDNLVEDYYTKLYEASKKNDGTYYLKEKIIYTDVEKDDTKYRVSIYKDYDKKNLIETKTVSEEELKSNPIKIDEYLDNASIITYVFKPNAINNNALYFDSSSIEIK